MRKDLGHDPRGLFVRKTYGAVREFFIGVAVSASNYYRRLCAALNIEPYHDFLLSLDLICGIKKGQAKLGLSMMAPADDASTSVAIVDQAVRSRVQPVGLAPVPRLAAPGLGRSLATDGARLRPALGCWSAPRSRSAASELCDRVAVGFRSLGAGTCKAATPSKRTLTQRLPIPNGEPPAGEADQPVAPEGLHHAVDVHNRKAERVADGGLRQVEGRRPIFDEPDVAVAQVRGSTSRLCEEPEDGPDLLLRRGTRRLADPADRDSS